MQVLGTYGLSKGSHRPRLLSRLLLSPAAAFPRYPAIELLAVESLSPLTG